MMLIIDRECMEYPLHFVSRKAKEIQEGDPDWHYKVEDLRNGLGRLDVYDEDNVLVQKGMRLSWTSMRLGVMMRCASTRMGIVYQYLTYLQI